MARPSVYFDPGGVSIRPAANPVNLSNQFYAQPVETLDLMPMLNAGLWAARQFQGVSERNAAQQAAEERARQKALLEQGEKEALAFVANNAEGLIGARDSYLSITKAIDASEGANPYRQAKIAEESGALAARKKYRDRLMGLVEQASVLTGPDGLEQFPFDTQKAKRDLWNETLSNTYALTILDGAVGAAKVKMAADAEFDAAVAKAQSAARVKFGNEMEAQGYHDLVQSYAAIEKHTDLDDETFKGNVILLEKEAAKSRGGLESTNTKTNLLSGLERGLRKVDDPTKMLSMLSMIGEIRLDNGLVIGNDEDGEKMLDRLRDHAYTELTHRRVTEGADRVHKEQALRTTLREQFFKSLNQATINNNVDGLTKINGAFDKFVSTLSGDEQTTALAERKNWMEMINGPATSGNAAVFGHYMAQIRTGKDLTSQIPLFASSGLFSPTQLGDIIEANAKGRDVSAVLKGSAYGSVKDKVEQHLKANIFPDARDDGDQAALRALFQRKIQPTLDNFDRGARALAETLVEKGDISTLDVWLNETLHPKTGLTVDLDKQFETFKAERARRLSEIEMANAVGKPAPLLKDSSDWIPSTELRKLEAENRARQDDTRFMSTRVPSERWEDFDNRVQKRLLTELGAVGLNVEDALPEAFKPGSQGGGGIASRVHKTAVLAFGKFLAEVQSQRSKASGWDASTFDNWAAARLTTLIDEQIQADFKDVFAPPPATPSTDLKQYKKNK